MKRHNRQQTTPATRARLPSLNQVNILLDVYVQVDRIRECDVITVWCGVVGVSCIPCACSQVHIRLLASPSVPEQTVSADLKCSERRCTT